MSKKLVLVDGSNQAYRAFHAIQMDMTAPDGLPTKALFGLVRALISIVKEEKPDYVLIVFDKGKSFRAEQFPEYKGHRPSMPDELQVQWPHLIPLAEAFGFQTYAKDDGFEADDVIGTMAKRYANEDISVTIVSNDKDFAQLVDEYITVYNPSHKTYYDADGVFKKWQVRPDQMVDYLSMMGDSSDNIPGVAGIGNKTAVQILSEFGDFETIYAEIEKNKHHKKLIAGKESFMQARALITIETDMDLEISLEDCIVRGYDYDDLVGMLQRFGFFKIITELGLRPKSSVPAVKRADAWVNLDTLLCPGQRISVHPYHKDSEIYLGIGIQKDLVVVDTLENLSDPHKELLSKCSWIVHDYKSMLPLIESKKLVAPQTVCDIMLEYHLVDASVRSELDVLALRMLNHQIEEPDKKEIFQESLFDVFNDTPIRSSVAERTQMVWMLHEVQEYSLPSDLVALEYEVLPILYQMEQRGVAVDVGVLNRISSHMTNSISSLEQEIYREAKKEFNINSPKQVAQILFEERGLKPLKKNKTGMSTNAQTLGLLLEETDDPFIHHLIRYRELAKLKGTYVDPLPTYMDAQGRIHTKLNQTITETGRLSSTDPNLQNIPIRTAEGRAIREAFVAPAGMCLISADYSQLELRILAHFCETGSLVQAFEEDIDIHEHTGRDLVGEGEEYSSAHRAAAKAINYGLMYGMSAFRLAKELRIPFKDASSYIERYFLRYPEVRSYMDTQIQKAKETGSVETIMGRKRRVANIHDRLRHVREGAERIAMNTPIQGSAADIVKKAMVDVDRALKESHPKALLLLQVHDELLIEAPEDQVEEIAKLVQKTMEDAVKLRVPLKVHVGVGANWSQVH